MFVFTPSSNKKGGMAECFVFAYAVRPFLQKIWRHLLIFFILAIDSKR